MRHSFRATLLVSGMLPLSDYICIAFISRVLLNRFAVGYLFGFDYFGFVGTICCCLSNDIGPKMNRKSKFFFIAPRNISK